MNSNHRLLSSAVCAIGLCFAATPAAQAQQNLDQRVGGAGACQAALPAYEGLIRKRPLAIQNEGTSTAFITCAPHQFEHLGDVTFGIAVTLINNTSSSVAVSCTGVTTEEPGSGQWDYISRSANVPAGSSATVGWHEEDADNDGVYTNVSCALPPGTGIRDIFIYNGSVE